MKLAAAASLLLVAGCQPASDAVFGARVRAYLLAHPEVLDEAVAQLEKNKTTAANAQTVQAIKDQRNAIERDARDFVANPNGKVTVTEFYDYNCTFCKAAAPQIVALIRDNPDVRFVFKEWPIFGGDSDRAAGLALAAKDSGKFLSLYEGFFAAPQHLDQAGMEAIAAQHGLDFAALKAKAVSPDVVKHLQDTHTLANALGIGGTPAFIVGDQVIAGADMVTLKAAIEAARKAA